jgi:hypothetical protein
MSPDKKSFEVEFRLKCYSSQQIVILGNIFELGDDNDITKVQMT